jgi:methionine synthase II (cobalamin-independent)
MSKTPITKEILIEDLVDDYPFSVEFLSKKGIRCLRCGEPIWGSLEEAANEKGFDDGQIQLFVDELKQMAENPGGNASQDQGGQKIDYGKIN